MSQSSLLEPPCSCERETLSFKWHLVQHHHYVKLGLSQRWTCFSTGHYFSFLVKLCSVSAVRLSLPCWLSVHLQWWRREGRAVLPPPPCEAMLLVLVCSKKAVIEREMYKTMLKITLVANAVIKSVKVICEILLQFKITFLFKYILECNFFIITPVFSQCHISDLSEIILICWHFSILIFLSEFFNNVVKCNFWSVKWILGL